MTLSEFRSTREWCDDLGAVLADCRWEDEPAKAQGYLYCGQLYIEKVLPHWPQAAREKGGWYLLLGNEDWITDDLDSLEEKLWDYAKSEGIDGGFADDQH